MAGEKKQKVALPLGKGVNVDCLAEALENANASYRFLILKIILQHVENQASADEITISLDDLRREMLVTAWFPVRHFQLSFGTQDMIEAALEKVVEGHGKVRRTRYTMVRKVRDDFKTQANDISKMSMVTNLTEHPIWVILKPWFKEKTKGLKYYQQKQPVIEQSNIRFESDSNPPLYKIARDGKTIHVHRLWREYFKDNRQIINGWLDSKWLQFLANQNPNVPNLANKLWELPPRPSLTKQRNYWNPFIESRGLRCFYRMDPIDIKDYHLDHFLPWSWAAHNQLWNLIPVTAEPNLGKSDRLPSKQLITKLAKQHIEALSFTKGRHDEGKWKDLVSDYIVGLNLQYEDLDKEQNIINAYNATMNAQLDLANLQGYQYMEDE